ncbi:MAG: DNA gyrase subunit A, partial [Sporolactobacillus sp.]
MSKREQLLDLPFEEVIGDRFGIYSKYIIQERALPDVRDGLKPVQRRILYAMFRDNNTSDKPFRKSAKTVGNVIGNYHPHGDSSVYEAMVRMSQDWKVRMPLIEMHGNNGSLDGDPPAAMRYTEARLSKISAELLRDLDSKTVDFVSNFDDSLEEPIVFPSKFPNLLVNGSTGISAGYATEIPPHSLSEIIDATIRLMEHPETTVDELMTIVKGPDFPSGGIVQGIDGIRKAYRTGKGKIVIRARTSVEPLRTGREQIIVTELPYEVNKALLVKKMDELRLDHKVEGVAEVRDETDRSGMRLVIELKKDADAQGIL